MEADVSGRAPGAEAVAVLRKQSALFDEQIGLARNERFRNRIKAVRDMALSAAVLGLLAGAGMVLWSAHRASGLVVEAFQTPPDMAEAGLDGSVVAARLLDRLSAHAGGHRQRAGGGDLRQQLGRRPGRGGASDRACRRARCGG